ncbi:MFS transporter [Legionella maioricensis]|uniref:MFS transporter n=1 Tax=Legionella maioricensis TaxID=2896528 RepID=A0A9X2ICN0_9GAMM|nr:MFS transporter [Legionella maioricensis]MCL9685386.1 MFS transporter [Legionella maioricensis]MCL9688655.1 MFS transporter [Legionella maioricensis]
MGSGFAYLLKERRFLPLFLTQFFGAFNDNAFKLAMLTMISYHLSHTQDQSEYYQALAGALFILPFFLFSATAGQLADKYDKALMARLVKVFEVILMIMGSFAFYKSNIFFMMLTLTGMGIHSAFFGPIKYAILPDHLPKKDILRATGLIEASTFLAILLGTTLGTLAIGTTNVTPFIAIFMTVFVAFAGLISSLFIPSAPSSSVVSLKIDLNIWRAIVNLLKQARKEPGVLLVILTISWFWLIGAVLLTKLPDYTHYVLGANTTVFAVFLALFSLGIAFGSLLISCILQGRITLSVVPGAMFLLTCFSFDLYWVSPIEEAKEPLLTLLSFFTDFNHWRITFDLFMLALSGGIFVVPLYAYLQVASQAETRARTIAANNIYNSLFMVLGTLLVMLLLKFKVAIPQVFLILGLLNILAASCLWIFLKKQKKNAEDRPHK